MFTRYLKNIAVRPAMAHGLTGFLWHSVFTRLANQGAQLLRIGVGALENPLTKRVIIGQQAVTPGFGQVQHQVVMRGATELIGQGGAHNFQRFGVEQAHLLADELHLAAFAFKVGDAVRFDHGILEFFGQGQALHPGCAQCQQVFTQLLQFQAFAFEIGAALVVGAFEFAFELEVAFAAFGDEFTSDEVTFFEFA